MSIAKPHKRLGEKGTYIIHKGISPKLTPDQRLSGLGVTVGEMKEYPALLRLAKRGAPIKFLENMLKAIRQAEKKK